MRSLATRQNRGTRKRLPQMCILDTDLYGDPDDASYIKVTHALRDLNELRIGCAVHSASDPYAPVCLEIINGYCGLQSIPIGAYQGNGHISVPIVGPFTQTVRDEYGPTYGVATKTRTAYPSPATVLRTFLAAQPGSSVVWLNGGFFNNMMDLMQSPADGISPLTGLQLFSAKVKRVIATLLLPDQMPSQEYNTGASQLASDSFAYVAANIPPAIELAIIDLTAARFFNVTPHGSNPVTRCYTASGATTRIGGDQQCSLMAARPELFQPLAPYIKGTAVRMSASSPWPSNWTAGGVHGNTTIYTYDATVPQLIQDLQDQTPYAAPQIISVGISDTTPVTGQVLSADVNVTGYPTPTQSLQWKVAGLVAGTGPNYTVQSGDLTKTITLTLLEAKNVKGSAGPVTSAATSPVIDPPASVPWQMTDLPTRPLAGMNAAQAVWSGSILTSIPNDGSVGGNLPQGAVSIVKGSQLNGVDTLDFNANNRWLAPTLPAITSGNICTVALVKVDSAAVSGLLCGPGNWQPFTSVGIYDYEPSIGPLAMGAGFSHNPPDVEGFSNPTVGQWAIVVWCLGSSGNLFRRNGVSLTPTTDKPAALESEPAGVWRMGAVEHAGTEPHRGPIRFQYILNYRPTLGDIQKIEGRFAHDAGLTSLLPSDHPYKTTQPMT